MIKLKEIVNVCHECSNDFNPNEKLRKSYEKKSNRGDCLDCMRNENRLYSKELAKKNPGRAATISARRDIKLKVNHPKKYTSRQMICSLARRSRVINKPHDLKAIDIERIFPDICPIFKCKLKYGGGPIANNSASLDRIDPTKGYSKDNIQVISNLANRMKSNATKEELRIFGEWALRL